MAKYALTVLLGDYGTEGKEFLRYLSTSAKTRFMNAEVVTMDEILDFVSRHHGAVGEQLERLMRMKAEIPDNLVLAGFENWIMRVKNNSPSGLHLFLTGLQNLEQCAIKRHFDTTSFIRPHGPVRSAPAVDEWYHKVPNVVSIDWHIPVLERVKLGVHACAAPLHVQEKMLRRLEHLNIPAPSAHSISTAHENLRRHVLGH